MDARTGGEEEGDDEVAVAVASGGTWGARGGDGALLTGSGWERARVTEEELCSGELVTRRSGSSSPGAMDGNSYGTETTEREK